MDVCLREIEKCQATGIKPNFIVLLGDRYGWRPLPTRIAASEFDPRPIAGDWYRLDENAVPPEYVLQPRLGIFTNPDIWRVIEQLIHARLEGAVRAAGVTGSALRKFTYSATHQEIMKGLGSAPSDVGNVFAFCRVGGCEDANLRHLKDELRERLGANFCEFRSGDSTGPAGLLPSGWRPLLLHRQNGSNPPGILKSKSNVTTLSHENGGRFFKGRINSLRRIQEYMKGSCGHLLLVHGESGSGKSALLAVASDLAARSTPGGVVIRRFIAAAPLSSDGVALLQSICREVAVQYGRRCEFPLEFYELVRIFREELNSASSDRPLAIFVDGLNQLSLHDPAATHPWLPAELPPYCHIVVSSTEIPQNATYGEAIAMEPFQSDEAEELLADLLMGAGGRCRPVSETS